MGSATVPYTGRSGGAVAEPENTADTVVHLKRQLAEQTLISATLP